MLGKSGLPLEHQFGLKEDRSISSTPDILKWGRRRFLTFGGFVMMRFQILGV